MATTNVGETTNVAKNLAKLIGTFLGGRPGTDTSGTHTADSAFTWSLTQVDLLGRFHMGQQFISKETGIVTTRRVILDASV
jgi:hypothetical protein